MRLVKKWIHELKKKHYINVLRSKHSFVSTNKIPIDVLKNGIGANVYLSGEVEIKNEQTIIGDFTYFNGGKVFYGDIGKFCSLGYGIIIGAGEHRTDTITTYPINGRINGNNVLTAKDFSIQKKAIIRNAVWVGNNAIIKQGVTVGDGAIVASGAVVTHDVPPYCVVGGVPARVIRFLFEKEQIKYLIEHPWWEWDKDLISKAVKEAAFDSFVTFKTFVERNFIV